MACYKPLNENVFVEQNIFDNGELFSFESSVMTMANGEQKTVVLYNYSQGNRRYYSLGLLENLRGENVTIIEHDLSKILSYKTSNVKRKHIYALIEQYESTLV